MVISLYTLLLRFALPFDLLMRWWHARATPNRRPDLKEVFGHYADLPIRGVIWLHTTSMSGIRSAAPLIRTLRVEYPDHDLLVSSSMAAGRDAVRKQYGGDILSAYLPYDLPGAAQHFVEHFRPHLGVMIETEIWPVLLSACQQHGIPIMLANARMSSNVARGYARLGALSRPAFGTLAASCAQNRATARRLRALGASAVTVTGNLDLDAPSDPSKVEEGRSLMAALRGRNVLLLASTCEGEEAMLLDQLGSDDGTLIVIVPRHPERFEAVAALIASRGLTCARRSRGEAPHIGRRVFLGDTAGEMPFYYAMSTVAILGGSFTTPGGQNPIEACAAGVPLVFGPHMDEFAEAARLAVSVGAAVQVGSAADAVQDASTLLGSREWRERVALAGLKIGFAHGGAVSRHLAECRRLLSATPAPSV